MKSVKTSLVQLGMLLCLLLISFNSKAQWGLVDTIEPYTWIAHVDGSQEDSAIIVTMGASGVQLKFMNTDEQITTSSNSSGFSTSSYVGFFGAVRYGDSIFIGAKNYPGGGGGNRDGELILYDMVNDSWSLVYEFKNVVTDFGLTTTGTDAYDMSMRDNWIYFTGTFRYTNKDYRIMAYNTLEDTMGVLPHSFDGFVYGSELMGTDVVIGGDFDSVNQSPTGTLVLLKNNGSIADAIASPNIDTLGSVVSLLPLSQDSIMVMYDNGQFQANHAIYSPVGLSYLPLLNYSRRGSSAALVNNKVYASNGYGGIHELNTTNNSWAVIPPPPNADTSVLFGFNSKLYLFKGETSFNTFIYRLGDSLSRVNLTYYIDFDGDCQRNGNDGSVRYHYLYSSNDYLRFFTSGVEVDQLLLPRGDYHIQSNYGGAPLQWSGCGSDTLNVNADTVNYSYSVKPANPQKGVGHDFYAQQGWRARQGFTEKYYLHFMNYGNAVNNCSYTLVHDSFDFDVKSVSVTPISNTGSMKWTLNFQPGEEKTIEISGSFPIAATGQYNFIVIPDPACSLMAIDTSLINVVGAYDPNDKQSSKPAEMPLGVQELQYMVRFQNTGTDTAYNVRIIDTLDRNLPMQYMKILGSSHELDSIHVHRDAIQGIYTLEFVFLDILLPDSTRDFDASQGFVRYEAKIAQGFGLGDSIENTAYIYFDYQNPVITNTVMNKYLNASDTLSVQDPGEESLLKVYPNPSKGILTLENDHDRQLNLDLIDPRGKRVRVIELKAFQKETIRIQGLASGMYLLRSSDGSVKQKLIILR